MATTKIILRDDKPNSKGECPLYLRFTSHRKSTYQFLGLHIKPKDWDSDACLVKKSYRNSSRINSYLLKVVADAQTMVVEEQIKKKPVTSDKLKEKFTGGEPVDLFVYSKAYIHSLEAGQQISSLKRANVVIEKLKTYCKEKPLYIHEITHNYLRDYENYLKTEVKNHPNTIHNNLRVIRKIINDAIKDGILSRDDNPFNKYKLKLVPTSRKYLLEVDVEAIEKLDLSEQTLMRAVRDIFIFACYTGGIRISDLLQLRWSDITDGRVNIRIQKTGSPQVVKLANKALEIIESCRDESTTPKSFVFPFIKSDTEIDTPIKLHNTISRKTALINNYLVKIMEKAEIKKKVSFHISRHTFATIALKKGIRMEYVSKLLGHANQKETQIYAKIINEELDKAMEVFND